MAASGTYTWQLNIADIIEDAYELAGWEGVSGYDAETARRSLNVLLTEWLSEGINLWTLEQTTVDLVDGTPSYSMSTRLIDIVEITLLNSTTYTSLEPISIEEYHNIPNKAQEGLPSQYAVNHTATKTIYLFPTPNSSTLDLKVWGVRRIQDVATSAEDPDVPHRFIPALILGLAWKLAAKKPVNSNLEAAQAEADRIDRLERWYVQAFDKARGMDKENASLYIRPKVR